MHRMHIDLFCKIQWPNNCKRVILRDNFSSPAILLDQLLYLRCKTSNSINWSIMPFVIIMQLQSITIMFYVSFSVHVVMVKVIFL